MAAITLSSDEFDQDVSRATEAASLGPVFITEHGVPAYVLLSVEGYRQLSGDSFSAQELARAEDLA